MSLKRTALYDEHVRLSGRLIDFGGWELPVQYSGVIDEHLACRTSAGLFDVSHMGEVLLEGQGAESFLNWLVSNNVAKLAIGQAQYSVMCNFEGGLVDDLVIYRRAADRFLVVINASNTEKDVAWMKARLAEFAPKHPHLPVRFDHASDRFSQIAIQGRTAEAITQKLTRTPLSEIKTYWFTEGTTCDSVPTLIARTGYTGEDGFELYVPWAEGPRVWRALLEAGTDLGLKPCGLGARDTLRTEMKYPLYGNELTDETNPIEAGVGWVTKLDKGDFVGRDRILPIKESGPRRKLVGFRALDRGIPRHGYPIYDQTGAKKIGVITSGTQSPCLKHAIAIGYVETPYAEIGSRVTVDVRGQKISTEVVATPFYKRPY